MTIQEQWQRRAEQQKRSGLSAAAWCRQQNIRENQFSYWRRRIGENSNGANEGKFVRVGTAEAVELIVNDKLRVKIPSNFDGAALKRLLEVLGC